MKKYISPCQLLRLLVFVVCAVLAMYQSVKSVIKYLENPIATSVSERQLTYDDFPYIVVCGANILANNKSEQNQYFESILGSSFLADGHSLINFPWGSVPLPDLKPEQFSSFYLNTRDTKALSFSADKGYPANGTTAYVVGYGPCMIFHPWMKSSHNRFLAIYGEINELAIKFASVPEDVYKLSKNYVEQIKYRVVDLEKQLNLHLEIKKVTKLSTSDRPCSKKKGYVQAKCFDKCASNYLMKNLTVKCGVPWLKPAIEAPECENFKDYANLEKAIDKESPAQSKAAKSCIKQCPEACTSMQYTTMITPFLSGLKESVALVTVDQTVKVVTEFSTYEFMNMIGDVGGIIGILLGFSVFGIYDFSAAYILNRKEEKKN